MKIGIVGGRDFDDNDLFLTNVEPLVELITEVVTGDCPTGADRLAEVFAVAYDLPYTKHTAEWKRFGNAAGPMRNTKVVASCEFLLAFWDGKSKGTEDTINKAKKAGLKVKIVYYNLESGVC